MQIVIEKRIYSNRTKLSKEGKTYKPTCYFINVYDGDKLLKKVLFTPVNNEDYRTLDLFASKVFDNSTKNSK